jgi:hypothetical protein
MKERLPFRMIAGAFFALTGFFLIHVLSEFRATFWHQACAWAFALGAVAWCWRPDIAAGLSLGPTLGLVFSFRDLGEGPNQLELALCIIVPIALLLIVGRLRPPQERLMFPVVVSLAFIVIAFATDRLFTNINKISTFDMSWADNGEAPWGKVEPSTRDGEPLTIFYRRFREGYCYDFVYSSQVRNWLLAAGTQTVKVEYDRFNGFGELESWDIRTINGHPFSKQINWVPGQVGTVYACDP